MSTSSQQKARSKVKSMRDFANACSELGLSAKKIVLEAINAGEDIQPYANAVLVTARYDRPGRGNGF